MASAQSQKTPLICKNYIKYNNYNLRIFKINTYLCNTFLNLYLKLILFI